MKYVAFGLVALFFASPALADESSGKITIKTVVVEGKRQVPLVIEVQRQRPRFASHPASGDPWPLHALQAPASLAGAAVRAP
jgi:hypothetical protein